MIASGLGVSAVSGRTCAKVPVPALFRRLRERVVGGRVRGTAGLGSRYESHAHRHIGVIAGPVAASAGQLFLLWKYWVASGVSVYSRRLPTWAPRTSRTWAGVAKKNRGAGWRG